MEIESSTALDGAKWAYRTRHVRRKDVGSILAPTEARAAGQLLLAEVTRLGQHNGVQLASGRRAQLYVGDPIVVCLGARYAPDQFEGVAQLEPSQTCELLAAGGVAGVVRHRHGRMRPATGLKVLGVLASADGRAMNIAAHAPALAQRAPSEAPRVPVIVVAGSSMNAGKTTACASLIHGLARGGWRVGAVKFTGTGSFGDVQSYADAGAAEVLDFTDAGLASTYLVAPEQIERSAQRMVAELEARGCEVIVAEVADGLFQQETAALMASTSFRAAMRQVVYAAADAMGAAAGVQRLLGLGWDVRAFTGLVTVSPLAVAEAEAALRSSGAAVPCLAREELRDPLHASRLAGLQRASLPLAA